MSLKRKGSRLIRVGGDSYRWTVEKIISAALAAGWSPQQRQKILACEWTKEEILIPLLGR